ncbi:hypothetical protein AK51_01075 [Serratia nematodiphila DZ0503SBS1]|nr:hypothetical protein AK51_01075 [Serratia nematodiphila DZ0503SBS1]
MKTPPRAKRNRTINDAFIDEPIRITPAIKRQLRGIKGSAGQQSANVNVAFKSGARTHSPEDITLRIRVNILIHQ